MTSHLALWTTRQVGLILSQTEAGATPVKAPNHLFQLKPIWFNPNYSQHKCPSSQVTRHRTANAIIVGLIPTSDSSPISIIQLQSSNLNQIKQRSVA
jgi:hypothetical protein